MDIPHSPKKLDRYLAERESAYNLKPGAQAQIKWSNPDHPQKTDYALIYLHGFTATHGEGEPVHQKIAEEFGCNLFLSRINKHGLVTDKPLSDLMEGDFIESAHLAFEIGKRIGKKMILMGTSTGGSMALYIAAQSSMKPHIHALILYSPLIAFYGFKQRLLGNTVFRKMLQFLPGSNYELSSPMTYAEERIWYPSYALRGALALGRFVEDHIKPKTFSLISCPVFVGYYYKDREAQDKVVSVKAILKMMMQLDTPEKMKKTINFSNAGTHVICSFLLSNAADEVLAETKAFLKSVV